ncbi:MAG: hypothetical protein ABFD00_04115, partial [Chloroherpetonaceae bacterium]
IDSMTFSDWGWISSDSSLAYFKGSVLSGDSSIIHICAPDNETFSYSIWIGAEVGGKIVKCDEALTDTIYENRCCDSVAYFHISEGESDCPCTRHSLHIEVASAGTTCFDSLQIGVTNIKNNDTTFKQFGNFRVEKDEDSTKLIADICVDEGKNKIVANLFDGGEIKCSHTYEEIYPIINYCDFFKIRQLPYGSFKGCPDSTYWEVINNMPCGDSIRLIVERREHYTGDFLYYLSDTKIPPRGKDIIFFTIPSPGVFQDHYIFKIGDSIVVCDVAHGHRCGGWSVSYLGLDPMGLIQANVDQDLNNWSVEMVAISEDPSLEIYKIEVIDPRDPNQPLFSETRNPGIDPPFNIYPNGFSIFTQTAPLDSRIVMDTYLWTNPDTIPVATMHFDSTIYGPMIYISNLQANPNPVNNSLNISYHVLAPVDVNVSVWDNFGIKIYDFGTSWHTVGDYNLNLDISQYVNGSYHVITTTRGDSQNLPFIINR